MYVHVHLCTNKCIIIISSFPRRALQPFTGKPVHKEKIIALLGAGEILVVGQPPALAELPGSVTHGFADGSVFSRGSASTRPAVSCPDCVII